MPIPASAQVLLYILQNGGKVKIEQAKNEVHKQAIKWHSFRSWVKKYRYALFDDKNDLVILTEKGLDYLKKILNNGKICQTGSNSTS